MADFMADASKKCELVLQNNEILDVFKDEFVQFDDDDLALGNRAENNIKELHSFTDLKYSKTKDITMVDWHPTQQGNSESRQSGR